MTPHDSGATAPAGTPAAMNSAGAAVARRPWAAPELVRHASLTVLTQHVALGELSLLFQGISGGSGGFGGSSPMGIAPHGIAPVRGQP